MNTHKIKQIALSTSLLLSLTLILVLLMPLMAAKQDGTGTRAGQTTVMSGTYQGTVAMNAPLSLGPLDLAFDLSDQNGVLSGSINDQYTLVVDGAPMLQGTLDTTPMTPTFSINSDVMNDTVSGRQVVRTLSLEGEVLEDGEVLQGTYHEVISGFTPNPMTMEGAFTVSRQPEGANRSLTLSSHSSRVATSDGQTTVMATVLDENGQPASGVVVTFSTNMGQLSPASATTNADGIATTTFTASDLPGQATITASCCDDLSQSITIIVETPSPTTLELEIANSFLHPGTQTGVTATVRDQFNDPVSGMVVTLQATQGSISPTSGVSDSNGQVSATFTAGNSIGDATITALAESTSASATIQISDGAPPTHTPTPTATGTPIGAGTSTPITTPTATPIGTPSSSTTIIRTGHYQVAPDDTFTMLVEVLNMPAPGLGAVKVLISYDSTLISPVEGECLVDAAFSGGCNINNNGVVQFNGVSISTPGVDGEQFDLAEITFKAIGEADLSSVLDISLTTFTDPNGTAIPVTDQDGWVTIGGQRGDVNCDSQANTIDALFILQYDIGMRDGSNQCPLPQNALYIGLCDVNSDAMCNVIDALFVSQCDIGLSNMFCPSARSLNNDLNQQKLGSASVEIGRYESLPLTMITVPVWATLPNDLALGGASVTVTYDANVVAVQTCTVHADLGGCNTETDGIVRFNTLSTNGQTGTFKVAEMTFQSIGQVGNHTALELDLQTFANTSGDAISVRDVDGEITITNALSNDHLLYLPLLLR